MYKLQKSHTFTSFPPLKFNSIFSRERPEMFGVFRRKILAERSRLISFRPAYGGKTVRNNPCTSNNSAKRGNLYRFPTFILFFALSWCTWKSETILMRRKQMITSCQKPFQVHQPSSDTREMRETSYNLIHTCTSPFVLKANFQSLPYLQKIAKFQLKWKRRPLNATGKLNLVPKATTFAKESGADIPIFWTNYTKNLKSLKENSTSHCSNNFVWKILVWVFYMEAFCFEASFRVQP